MVLQKPGTFDEIFLSVSLTQNIRPETSVKNLWYK